MSLTEVAGNKYSDHHKGYKYISQLHLHVPLTISTTNIDVVTFIDKEIGLFRGLKIYPFKYGKISLPLLPIECI